MKFEKLKGNFQKPKNKILFAIAFIALILGAYGMLYLDMKNSPITKTPWVLWHNDPASEVIIGWETEKNEDGIVYYGTSKTALNSLKTNITVGNFHHILLQGLQSNTTYYYKIGSVNPIVVNNSQVFSFRTAPSDSTTTFDFIVTSDTQQFGIANGWTNHLAKVVATKKPSFFMIVGDLTQEGRTKSNWDDFFQNIQPITNSIPLVPIIGNHEANLDDNNEFPAWMHTYFPISDSNTQFFYAFNYSMVHFVSLDVQWGTQYDLSTEQMDWLKADLERAQSLPFRIVSFHCPIRDSGIFGNNSLLQTQLKPIMQQYNVSLILNGHDHHYERVYDDGLNYIVQGGGGDMQDPFIVTTDKTTKIVFGPTYTRIIASSTTLTISAYTLYGAIVDSFIIPAGGII